MERRKRQKSKKKKNSFFVCLVLGFFYFIGSGGWSWKDSEMNGIGVGAWYESHKESIKSIKKDFGLPSY